MTPKPGRCSIRLLVVGVLTSLLLGACKGPVVWNADVKSFIKNGMTGIETPLSNLVIDGNVLPNGAFSFKTTSYSRGLFYNLGSVTFTATAAISGQRLQYKWNSGNWTTISSGAKSPALTTIENAAANSGTVNTLLVKVTAADGQETSTYSVQFSDDGAWSVKSALSNLVVPTVLPSGSFSLGTTSYPRGLFQGLTTVTFTATEAVPGQQLQYNWNKGGWTPISSGVASPALTVVEDTAVNNGTDNTLGVKVTAVDGKTTTTYTVQFSKGYTITYDPNGATSGGTAPTDSTLYEAGQPVTLLGNAGSLTETEGTFNGWNSAADGSGTAYAVGSTLAMVSGGVTVYTRWQGAYTLGQTIAGGNGGIVFYDKGFYSNSWRFLAAAPSDQSTSCAWAPTAAATGATSWNVGDGLANTGMIDTANPTATAANCAAYLCATLSFGGYTDWFLPSESELYEMYVGNSLYGLNMASQWYWSSTQSGNSSFAMMLNLTGTGSLQPSFGVTGAAYVRAIREF